MIEISTAFDVLAIPQGVTRVVLVSGDDTALTAGGGVSMVIAKRAGPAVASERAAAVAAAGGRLPLGTTIVTSGGQTGALAIIHAVTLDWHAARAVQHQLLAELLLRVLDHAAALDATTVMLPRIATGIGGRPVEEYREALRIALNNHLMGPTPLRQLVLCATDGVADHPLESRAVLTGWPHPQERGRALPVYRDAVSGALGRHVQHLAANHDGGTRTGLTALARGLATPGAGGALRGTANRLIDWIPPESFLQPSVRALGRLADNPPPDSPEWVATLRGLRSAGEALHTGVAGGEISSATTAGAIGKLSGAASTNAALAWIGGAALGAAPGTSLWGWVLRAVVPGFGGGKANRALHADQRGEAMGISSREGTRPPVMLAHDPTVPSYVPDPTVPQERARSRAERVAQLMVEHMTPEDAAFERERIVAKHGTRGDTISCFTEWVLIEKAAAVLRKLPPRKRAEIAVEWAGLPESSRFDEDAAIDAILSKLGYPTQDPPRGLASYCTRLTDLRNLAESAPNAAAPFVVEAGILLEAVLKELIIFHTSAFLGDQVDETLREAGVLKEGRTVRGEALGSLGIYAAKLTSRLHKNPGWSARFGQRSLVPEGMKALADGRNAFAHHGRDQGAEQARNFFAHADGLMAHLGRDLPPVFPMVFVAEQRVEDCDGVTYKGRSDSGKPEEVHTDQRMELGSRYYLLAHSNPMRVFPFQRTVPEEFLAG